MSDNHSKMFAVAQQLKEKIKGRDPYVVIHHFSLGCRIVLAPNESGTLIIGLYISPNAESKRPEVCRRAITEFERFFGNKSKPETWTHPADDRDTWKRLSVDVSNTSIPELTTIAGKLKTKCA